MTVFAGDPIYASTVNGVLPRLYVKSAGEARNTTTTLADDAELAGITLEAGTYSIELVLYYTLSTTTAQKIKTQWAFSGTWNSPVRACIGPGSTNTSAPDQVTPSTFRAYTDSQDAIYDSSTSASWSCVREVAANVVVTAAGNLSLQWAQNASSGNNTTVNAETAFRIQKIA